MSIAGKIVQGAQFINRNAAAAKAIAGGALALGGAAIIGQAFFRTPEAQKRSKDQGDLMFPSDLIDPSANRNFYMTIQFTEYQRRSIFNQPFLKAVGGIRLPIPNNLTDTQNISYDPTGSDPTQGAAMEAGLAGRNGAGSSGNFAGSLASAAGAALGGKAVDTATKLAQGVGIDTAQALQLGGLAQNPFLTVLFKSPSFKKHQFSWKLAPTSPQESDTVRQIINTFRSNILPAMAPNAGGTLLTYPNMCQISLYPDDSFLYRFKPCVVESMSVNFASSGAPSFFKNTNAPTEVTLTIDLLEIEYWLKEDVEGTDLRSGGSFLGGLF